MHKIRNTQHLEVLDELYQMDLCKKKHISKRILKDLLTSYKWDKHKVLQQIKNDEWWYRYIKD